MRRLLVLAAIAAAALLVPAAHSALAGPDAKVKICHLNSSNTSAVEEYDSSGYEYWYGYEYQWDYHYTYTISFGNVIEVAASAVPGHEGHGDSTYYWALDSWLIDYLSTWSQYSYSGSYSWDGRPYGYDYYYYYEYSYVLTDANIKNADCYIWNYVEE